MIVYGRQDKYWVDVPMMRQELEDGSFVDIVNKLTDLWACEVTAVGRKPANGTRVKFSCVIEDLPRDMMVIRVTGDVQAS